MAERETIAADVRSRIGKKSKQLRREGLVPAVIYGQGENLNIQLDSLTLRRVLRNAGLTALIDIQVGEDVRTVLAREIQTHVTRGDLIHIDFYEVNMQETIVVEAALLTVGVAAPAADGLGTISQSLHAVEIETLPGNLISEIAVDLSQIATPDDMIYVRDLPIPEGVKVLTDPELVVARFEYLQEEEEEEEIEEEFMFGPAADDVEVIGRGKEEEEEVEE